MRFVQATIVRNAKDTAHTKAERNILEGVKVLMPYCLFWLCEMKSMLNVIVI